MSTVYVIAAEGGHVKVGKAINPTARLAQLSTGTPFRLRLAHSESAEGLDAHRLERLAHSLLRSFRVQGEWFQVTAEQAIEAVRTAADRLRNPTLPPEFERAKAKAVVPVSAKMTPVQCRMARVALDLGVRELAAAADVSASTVTRFEKGEELKPRTVDAMRRALEAAGVEFIPENGGGAGVRLSRRV